MTEEKQTIKETVEDHKKRTKHDRIGWRHFQKGGGTYFCCECEEELR